MDDQLEGDWISSHNVAELVHSGSAMHDEASQISSILTTKLYFLEDI